MTRIPKCVGSGREAIHSDGSYTWFCPYCGFRPKVPSCQSYVILRPHLNREQVLLANARKKLDKGCRT